MSIRSGPPAYSACTANCKSQNSLLVRWHINQDPQAPSVDIRAIFRAAKTLKSRSLPTCFQVHSLLKNSAYSAPSLTGDLLTLKPRNNCSVIRLQLMWKVHQPTSNWSRLNSSVVTRSSQSLTLWVLHSFHVSSPIQCPNSVPKLLKCSLCSAAHIYVNSYSL